MGSTHSQNGRDSHADRSKPSETLQVPARRGLAAHGEHLEILRRAAFHELEISLLRDGARAAAKDFQALRQRFPDLLGESLVNILGYILLAKRDLATAIEAFKLNVEAFPESANAHDSLAEAYLAAGETALAIVHYRRSVELDPQNAHGMAMLEQLGQRSLAEH